MLNLDTEEWGSVYIGCAGGGDTRAHLPVGSEAVPSGMVRHRRPPSPPTQHS